MKTTANDADSKPYVHTHVMRQWSEIFNRCIWCGHYERRAPIADAAPPQLKPTVYGLRAATAEEIAHVDAMLADPPRVPRSTIETVFASMAREYYAKCEALQQWVRSGNELPKVYRS